MPSSQRSQSPNLPFRDSRGKKPVVPLAVALGSIIRQLREDAGWTQEAFADHCGFFRTYLSRIETGKANPTLNVIEVISKAIHMQASALLVMAEEHQFKSPVK